MSKIYHCPICREPFDKPRGLPCLHYFCTKCLQKYIDNTFLEPRGFKCPYCRKLTAPDDISIPVNMWAEGFPVANTVDEMMKLLFVTKSKNMNPSGPDYCDVCLQQNNVDSDAVAFCKGCMINLCPGCYDKHPQDHNIMVSKEFITSPLLCLEHKQAISDLFCCKCLVFTCTDCVLSKHTSCKEEGAVKSSESAVKELREQSKIYIENLETQQKDYQKFLNELTETGQELKQYEAKVVTSKGGEIYRQHLKTLDEQMCEVQHLSNRIHKELECRILHQKTENDLQYLQEHLNLFTPNKKNDNLLQDTRYKLISQKNSLSSFQAKLTATVEKLLHTSEEAKNSLMRQI